MLLYHDPRGQQSPMRDEPVCSAIQSALGRLRAKRCAMNYKRRSAMRGPGGNSAPSFIQTFTLLHSTFTVQIATPGGRPLEFVNQDDQSRRWLNDFRMKVFAIPIGLHTVDPNRYSCLILPHSPGAVHDLCENKDLGQILRHFIQEKKPICAIGMGVAGLFSAMEDSDVWSFRRCTLTAVSSTPLPIHASSIVACPL
ncbi:hypothetical protein HPB50_027527 [Hyalomma asiaticum]|uniref:Uncharacterized protein n=1 Tax=Hyalomma asiaticum TaxID=266040 RepID=A0ACB7SUA0_HYAAI|nr:hypothetical protein HPB50_027527 [Hyalomma asiaticum]